MKTNYNNYNGLGKKLKTLRKEKGLTLEKLAEVFSNKSETTIHKSMISNWENEKVTPSMNTIRMYCSYFGVSLDWIIGLGNAQKNTIIAEPEKEDNKIESNVQYIIETNKMIPLYESISAGYGLVEGEFIEYMPAFNLKGNPSEYFAIKVVGDSMYPKIIQGSIIVIHKDVEILNGQIGAFNINGNSVVKMKVIKNNKLYLKSLNEDYEDIEVKVQDAFKEYGKVVQMITDF